MTLLQLNLTGEPDPAPVSSSPTADPPAAPERPPTQLGLDVDVPVAITLPRGLGTAYQDPLL